MERKLASVQRVLSLDPIPGADRIEVATILGWKCVVRKGEVQVGALVVYFEVDSILPDIPEFDFLAKMGLPRMDFENNEAKATGYRLRTIKLRKQVSQGLCLPLSTFSSLAFASEFTELEEGDDVTEYLGVLKYEPVIGAHLQGKVRGNFPSFLSKTDETRIQAYPSILERHRGKDFYVTEKLDGSSMTVYLHQGVFGVCSRNMDYKLDGENEHNAFVKTAIALRLQEKLTAMCELYEGRHAAGYQGLALQGELVGPGIQKNKYDLKGYEYHVFNVYDIGQQNLIDFYTMTALLAQQGISKVPVIDPCLKLLDTVESLVEFSKGKSTLNPQADREGLVFRPLIPESDEKFGRLSFKVINPDFLLKHEE